jgi:hypothetical protein
VEECKVLKGRLSTRERGLSTREMNLTQWIWMRVLESAMGTRMGVAWNQAWEKIFTL